MYSSIGNCNYNVQNVPKKMLNFTLMYKNGLAHPFYIVHSYLFSLLQTILVLLSWFEDLSIYDCCIFVFVLPTTWVLKHHEYNFCPEKVFKQIIKLNCELFSLFILCTIQNDNIYYLFSLFVYLTWTNVPKWPGSGLHLLHLNDVLGANQSIASVGHTWSRNSWDIIQQRQEAVICIVFLSLLENGIHCSLCTSTGLKHPGNSSGYSNCISWFPSWTKDHVNIWTSKSKGVDAYDSASHRERLSNNLNPSISEGEYVRVRTIEVQVGSPDSSLQRKQHLCVIWRTEVTVPWKLRFSS